MRVLGLIGGLGPGSTAIVYRNLVRAYAERGLPAQFFMANAEVGRVLPLVAARDLTGLADYLAGLIRSLTVAGAEFAAIPAVLPHICAPELRERIAVPLVDIIDTTAATLKARGIVRVALFGAGAVVESAMFGRLEGVSVVTPRPEEIERIDAIYRTLVGTAASTDAQRGELIEIGRMLRAREGVEAIVLAGTELTLAFDEATTPEFPVVDCAKSHIAAILDAAADA